MTVGLLITYEALCHLTSACFPDLICHSLPPYYALATQHCSKLVEIFFYPRAFAYALYLPRMPLLQISVWMTPYPSVDNTDIMASVRLSLPPDLKESPPLSQHSV